MQANQICPCNHNSCVISSLRGLRNGVYYGGKIRLIHSLVMQILFGKGSLKSKLKVILKTTYEHSRNLGLFVLFYKSFVCILNKLRGTNSNIHSMISGAIFGSIFWGKNTPVNMQINLYLLSRVIQGILNYMQKIKILPKVKFFRVFAFIVWGIVMYLYELDHKSLQPSLSSSMTFIYKDSDKDIVNWLDYVPFAIPGFIKKLLIKSDNLDE